MSSSCESLNQSMSRLNSTPEFPPGRSRVGEAALLCVIDSVGVHLLLVLASVYSPVLTFVCSRADMASTHLS